MKLGIRFKHVMVRYLARCVIVAVIGAICTNVSSTHAQSVTDFNQLPDEAFEAGLIIDVYETPQTGYRYAVALRSAPEYIHILDSSFEQITYFTPTQSPEVAAEQAYGILDLMWSPDGNWLVATIDVLMSSYVQIWNTTTGQLVSTTRGFFNGVTAWSPNSDQVAVSEEDSVLVINATSGQVSHQFLLPVYPQAFELGWDAGGEQLAARNGQGIVNIWSVDTETLVFEINTENAGLAPSEIGSQNLPIYALFAWNPNGGNQIALYDSSSLNIEIWDIAQQQFVASFPTDIDNLRELRWSLLGLILYDTFPRGEPDSIRVLSPLDGSVLKEMILQQPNEYVIAFLNLDDPVAVNIVLGTAPLNRELASALTVETISTNPLPTATSTATPTSTPTSTPTLTPSPTDTPTATFTPTLTPTSTFTLTSTPTFTPTPSIVCTITVNGGDALGLVNAISAANANGASPDTICLTNSTYGFFSASNSIALPSITTPITIVGNGSILERGSGASNFRLFNVTATGSLTLQNLTVRNFNASGNNGGAILNAGTVALNGVTICCTARWIVASLGACPSRS